MNCPNCGHEMIDCSVDKWRKWACSTCALIGPQAAFETLAKRLTLDDAARPYAPWLEDRIADLETQLEAERDRRIEAERPAAVLAEAERLLREQDISEARLWRETWYGAPANVTLTRRDDRAEHNGLSLAEAYEKLKGGRGE